MNIDDVEAKIRSAVADAKAKGWRIICQAYYDGKNGCCPLGALVIDNIANESQKAAVPERSGALLGISPREAIDIACGVDTDTGRVAVVLNDGTLRPCPSEFVALGRRLRDLVDT